MHAFELGGHHARHRHHRLRMRFEVPLAQTEEDAERIREVRAGPADTAYEGDLIERRHGKPRHDELANPGG